MFSAAGNGSIELAGANSPWIVTVAGTDENDGKASFSTSGLFVDVSAPAVSIWTTTRSNTYGPASGTSFCTPLVAGAASVVWSVHPTWTNAQVEDALESSAVDLGAPGWDPVFGWGRIDLRRAVNPS